MALINRVFSSKPLLSGASLWRFLLGIFVLTEQQTEKLANSTANNNSVDFN